jgi:hypothetical protein
MDTISYIPSLKQLLPLNIEHGKLHILKQPLLTPLLQPAQTRQILTLAYPRNRLIELTGHPHPIPLPTQLVIRTVLNLLKGHQRHNLLNLRHILRIALRNRH